ncbi:hypothetical protein GFS31_38560 [Leptolyngbya sp. BL0902]|uniref:hypothetical protein n=1 Tax=Leptolyngbya sp. BL0902 TaxID=1115757 RepID=UPI0018E9023C|nr:hypothetical protein [Leptolyngbya sp. BL0902]QQE67144.1 hypothetical protein GFS31_38560 [Leptolyngbya sp. BL0902]
MLANFQTYTNPRLTAQSSSKTSSLPEVWARKYVESLHRQDQALAGLNQSQSKADVAQNLLESLRSISANAWNKTETLIGHEIRRHQISRDLVDPWTIAKDAHHVYELALDAYANDVSPQRFSVVASKKLGAIRQGHTAMDPRVIGFVSMQFHYCGQMLSEAAPPSERPVLHDFFKVVDDQLYMPLHRAYEAAANYDYDHPRLKAVRLALPAITGIAHTIVDRVAQAYPRYATYTGSLSSDVVRTSSVRDVEMFQIYLLTCVLEDNVGAIAQELFPLCVMLYPALRVSWELVRLMVSLLHQEISRCVGRMNMQHFEPYTQVLFDMFSPEFFPDTL